MRSITSWEVSEEAKEKGLPETVAVAEADSSSSAEASSSCITSAAAAARR